MYTHRHDSKRRSHLIWPWEYLNTIEWMNFITFWWCWWWWYCCCCCWCRRRCFGFVVFFLLLLTAILMFHIQHILLLLSSNEFFPWSFLRLAVFLFGYCWICAFDSHFNTTNSIPLTCDERESELANLSIYFVYFVYVILFPFSFAPPNFPYILFYSLFFSCSFATISIAWFI